MAAEALARERKREKEEAAIAKKKIQDKIAAGAEARKRKAAGLAPADEAPAAAASPAPAASKKEHTSCIIMVKFLDGSSQKISFKPEETIGHVHLHIANLAMSGEMDGWALASMFPREIYTQEKHSTTLQAAGLVPKAQLVVQKL